MPVVDVMYEYFEAMLNDAFYHIDLFFSLMLLTTKRFL